MTGDRSPSGSTSHQFGIPIVGTTRNECADCILAIARPSNDRFGEAKNPNRSMLRHTHFGTKGGLRNFAAGAKSKGQRKESGRSGPRPSIFRCASAANCGCEPIVAVVLLVRDHCIHFYLDEPLWVYETVNRHNCVHWACI
jgi:hypothetical protein